VGRSDWDIANKLFISPKTASVYVPNILGKLGAAGFGEGRTSFALLDPMNIGSRPLW
jgi:DNA-binding NarL/FixJ family response regulator